MAVAAAWLVALVVLIALCKIARRADRLLEHVHPDPHFVRRSQKHIPQHGARPRGAPTNNQEVTDEVPRV